MHIIYFVVKLIQKQVPLPPDWAANLLEYVCVHYGKNKQLEGTAMVFSLHCNAQLERDVLLIKALEIAPATLKWISVHNSHTHQ